MPIEECQVNIRQLVPPEKRKVCQEDVISLGDLHSNPMKLLHTLAHYGIIDISEDVFSALWALYDAMPIDIDDPIKADKAIVLFNQFAQLIEPLVLTHPGLLIFIGDELADRGKNDLLMLFVFKKLHDSKLPYWIQLSNHGLQALAHFEKASLEPLMKGQEQSLDALIQLENHVPMLYEFVMTEYVTDAYRKHIALVGYQVPETETLGLYTHAPVDLITLTRLAEEFEVPFDSSNMIHCINEINAKASKAICEGVFIEKYISSGSDYKKSALCELLWNRESAGFPRIPIPSLAFNVHGHVGARYPIKVPYFNLDNDLGKPDEIAFDLQGIPKGIIPADDEGGCLIFREPLTQLDYDSQYYLEAMKHYLPREVASLEDKEETLTFISDAVGNTSTDNALSYEQAREKKRSRDTLDTEPLNEGRKKISGTQEDDEAVSLDDKTHFKK